MTITFNGDTLVENTDYTVAYFNNVNVGTATATANGIGNFTRTASKNFTIVPDTLHVSISRAGYGTVYADRNLAVPAGVEVYGYTYDAASNALVPGALISEGAILPANKGFVVKATANSTVVFTYTDAAAGSYVSDLTGCTAATATDAEGKISGKKVYVLWTPQNSTNTTFYRYRGTIPAHKAYYLKSVE